MPRAGSFLQRQRNKATFAALGLNPDAPLATAQAVQLLGRGTRLMQLPTDVSQQYPLTNDAGAFIFRFGLDDPNDPTLVI